MENPQSYGAAKLKGINGERLEKKEVHFRVVSRPKFRCGDIPFCIMKSPAQPGQVPPSRRRPNHEDGDEDSDFELCV